MPTFDRVLTPKSAQAPSSRLTKLLLRGSALAALAALALTASRDAMIQAQAGSSCGPTINPIVCENQKAGDPESLWDVSGAGDSTIQGFAADFSAIPGQTVRFKIDTDASDYTIDIYRLGYYNGNGARRIASIEPSASLPQNQPACLLQSATGLIDCGNWAVSASWPIPAGTVSGVYFAKLTRTDTGGASHIFFIVRDDTGASEMVFQTSDTTWQAYNDYGGRSLYVGGPGTNPGRAYKVSYNRPFATRGTAPEDFVFNAEYPMIRFLERNGYNISYISGIDTDRAAAELLEHRVFLSVGHDEYWSGRQRANVEAARAAGVNLAFFSGNEVFWKTRWEPSIDGSATPYRTLVSYKETHANLKIDPDPAWTGTWRDPRFTPPSDGGRPEHALTGTLFRVNAGNDAAIRVPAANGKLRFWRNTSIATLANGAVATLPANTLGYEWDEAPNDALAPAGLMRLSSTTVNASSVLLDNGSSYGAGTVTHSLTLYRHSSGALVFGAGTVQWPWGLDSNHDRGSAAADARMQQATVNLFADMGVSANTLQAGLIQTTESTDTLAPASVITTPASGASLPAGSAVTISGTATENGGGLVTGVQVSVDGGITWAAATGTTSWTFAWTASGSGTINIRSRAFDDSGNRETPSGGVSVTVTSGQTCPCTMWSPQAVPPQADDGDPASVELGTRFRSDVSGYVTGVRFYKAALNTGTHVGRLWTNTGTLLGSVTFTGESASGWQQANFASPIPIDANTTYVVSYHAPNGHYTGTDLFFASALDNPPLHGLRDGTDGPNGVYLYGAGGFPNQTYFSEAYWVDAVFNTVPPPDSTPPTIASVFPASGAANVDPAAVVTASFSEAIDPATVSSSTAGKEGTSTAGTFELRDPLNILVTAAVSYDPVTRTATLRPAIPLSVSTTYTAVAKGGSVDPRIKDVAGNALASTATWSFTTAAAPPPPPSCPCSIWAPTAVPQKIDDGDPNSVELGTRFRSDVPGYITGARYYKGSANTGTHIAKLWTNTGTLLGSGTFTGETASGWQEVAFATPIAISANTTYVISYHANNGHYSSSPQYFAAAGVDSGPLHALRDGVDGANGLYQYGTSTFPTQTFNSEAYFIDVVFNTSIGPDTTPPAVSSFSPGNGVSGVKTDVVPAVTFNERMDVATITSSTLVLRNAANQVVTASVAYTDATRVATITPSAALQYSTAYTITVEGGTTEPRVKDRAGNGLAADVSWSFTTAAPPPPPPTHGPGGPVLVVTSAANPFANYYAEILRTEGFNAFSVADLSTLTAASLAGYDAVILGEMALTPSQVTLLSDYVTAGGNLIAMKPDKQLAGLLGLTDANATLSNGYLLVNTALPPGAGIVNQTVQFHGAADRYTLNGAVSLATLYASASTATANPAVTMRSVGPNGGQAVAFAFDLARSIVLTRQGNPAWSSQDRDALAPIRSNDLFYGAAAGNVQPDWNDFSKIAIPQADEQQRFLWNILLHVNADKKPLPKFWYFPRMLKAVVIMTGDDHANGGTNGRFDSYLSASTPGCSVADWECIRGTSYVFPGTPIDPAQGASYTAQGFEIALHVNTGCADYTAANLPNFYTSQLSQFATAYPFAPTPTTNRTHCIPWSDYTTQAQVQASNGIRFDTNYYYWPAGWVQNRPGMFTGSGLPMRFATSTGQMIDVYQAATQITDESEQAYATHIDTLLNNALGAAGYYAAVTANMHTDFNPSEGSIGSDAIVASAKARGVPVITARQMLEWLDGRHGSSFENLAWNGSTLSFDIAVGAGANGLRAMVPTSSGGLPIVDVTRNNVPVTFSVEQIKGVEYAIFPGQSGSYRVNYGSDTTPPVIAGAAASVSGSSATISWTTNEASDSLVVYGTGPASLTQIASAAPLVTSHGVGLTGLASGTTYHYRVSSADANNNVAEYPPIGTAPLTFSTPAPSVSIGDATLVEGNAGTSNAVFQLTLSGPASQTVTVGYATSNGTATAPSDYAPSSGTVTFDPGVTSRTIQVAVNGDASNEATETFAVSLNNPVNVGIARAVATGTIVDDDPLPSLSVNDVAVTEGNAGIADAVFTVTLSPPSGRTVTVAFATAAGTATAAADYVTTSGTLTFNPGVVTQTINVPVVGDQLNEAGEQYSVALSGATNAALGDAQGAGTIADDDPLPSISVADVTVIEGNSGTTNAVFTLTLSAPSGRTATVGYASANGSAAAGSDYTAATGTATFAAGATTASVTVAVAGDLGVEADETFVLNLSAPSNATIARAQATATIQSDDVPTVSIADVSVAEGASTAVFQVALTGPASQTVTVNYATSNGTAASAGDYAAASGTVTFDPGVTTRTVDVALVADAIDEADETFSVSLSNPVNIAIGRGTATATIVDDDALPSLAIGDLTVIEGNTGVANAVFTVTLSPASGRTVTVGFATAAGTASAGSDFTTTSGTLTFNAGTATQTVTIPVAGDLLNEDDEQYTVTLSGAANATIADAQATGTIRNDDPVPSIAIADVAVLEGNTGTRTAVFGLTLSAASGRAVTVGYTTANGTATAGSDYTAASGTATFAAGATTASVGIVVTGDTVIEADETFVVNLSAPANATIARTQAIGTIQNDESLPALSIADVSLAEGNSGTVNAVLTVTLSAANLQPVTVNYATADGTAAAGTDYTAATGTLTFNPGVITQSITVVVTGDTATEPNETVTVDLSSPTNATIADGQGVVTITNDDGATGLVAAYGFDEGSGTATADKSGTGNNATISGATWSTAGHTGNALSFDGVNDRVFAADVASLDVTRMTLSAWVRPSALSGWRTVILKEGNDALGYALYAHDNANWPAAYINTGQQADRRTEGVTALPLNTWTHLAATYDGATLRIYINGVQVRSRAFTGNIANRPGPLSIGGNNVWGEWFSGLIDDVRVYNRALTLAEIQADMNTPVAP
jgi:hypothetical protein